VPLCFKTNSNIAGFSVLSSHVEEADQTVVSAKMGFAKATNYFDQSTGTTSTVDAAECSDNEWTNYTDIEEDTSPAQSIICIEDESGVSIDEEPSVRKTNLRARNSISELHASNASIYSEVSTDAEPSVRKTNLRSRDSMVNLNEKVNDSELHASNANLKDRLVLSHSFHIDAGFHIDAVEAANLKSKLIEMPGGILTNAFESQSEDKLKRKKEVRFANVHVRDYGMILGDHPSCSYGPPVTLDWDYLEYEPLEINEYEYHHPTRRSFRQMNMNYYMRMDLLTKAGHTDQDFAASKKLQSKVKMNRAITKTCQVYQFNRVEYAMESACRKIKRMSGKKDHWKSEEEKDTITKLRRQDSSRQLSMMSPTSSRSSMHRTASVPFF